MTPSRHPPTPVGRRLRWAGLALVLGGAALASGAASAQAPRHRATHGYSRIATAPALTVHRRVYRPLLLPDPSIDLEEDYVPGFLRAWDDPNLDSFGGWRLGGDNFYGDQAGDPGTRGNASLGMISGYGPANGGYGGPHFDSVGGFHNGPGPGAQEAADYASGTIWRPRYDGTVPHYLSLRAQVAALNEGVVTRPEAVRLSHVAYRRETPAYRASAEADSRRAIAAFEAPPPPRDDDGFPDLTPDGDF